MRRVTRCEETGPNDGDYRYLLEVDLGLPGPRLAVVGKNPSMASAERSDSTLGKIEAWAARHGFGSVVLVNLFAVRHTDPKDVLRHSYEAAVGPENDQWLRVAVDAADTVVAGWGNPGPIDPSEYDRRAVEVMGLVGEERLSVVGSRTAAGYPRHGRLWNNDPDLAPWLVGENALA